MTLPAERTRAILSAREFLIRLSSPYLKNGCKKIPMAVRAEARNILRHFPNWVDLTNPEALDGQAAESFGEWLEKRDHETC